MKVFWNRILLTLVVIALSHAAHGLQSSAETVTQDQPGAGTGGQAEILGAIDVRKAHAGETFRARLWEDVRLNGKTILPQKTILSGHVVEAHPHTKDEPESRISIAFDKAILKDGTELPLHGVVENVQLSAMAADAAQNISAAKYDDARNPSTTTNMAMPGSGQHRESLPTLGPSGVLDPNLILKIDAAGLQTVFISNTKADVKIKEHSTLTIRITHIGA